MSMRTDLVLDTIEQAIWTRARDGVTDLSGVVHHNDAGSQGEFNWPSQHLDVEVLWWVLVRGSGMFASTEVRCRRRGDRASPGVRTVSGSGPGLVKACGRRMRRPRSACRRRWARDGFATLAA
jgi:putative transposase